VSDDVTEVGRYTNSITITICVSKKKRF